jgi:uncharacterized membrane protein (UPF0127 family)
MNHHFDALPVASGPWKRLAGLIGKRDRLFLLIPRCAAVHTWFMRSAIDVVFLDERTVVGIRESVAPFRIAVGPRGTTSVLELPPGHARAIGLSVGDAVTTAR